MRLLLLLCLLLAPACGDSTTTETGDQPMGSATSNQSQPAPQGEDDGPQTPQNLRGPAWRLEVRENWIDSIDILQMESAPPQFALKVNVTMPTPEWQLNVDEVSRPDAQGRIQIFVTGTPPDGIVAQVLEQESFTANLGGLDAGDYLVDVRYRRAGEEAYKPRGTALLEAIGR